MQKTDLLATGNPERQELEIVIDSLERMPKLASLMRYLGEKYFSGEGGQITEYNIATEVFERKKTTFIASEDSVARVQTHRLRKKLKEFYDAEGREHPIKISIPPGSYVPVFLHQDVSGEQYPEFQEDIVLHEDTDNSEKPAQHPNEVKNQVPPSFGEEALENASRGQRFADTEPSPQIRRWRGLRLSAAVLLVLAICAIVLAALLKKFPIGSRQNSQSASSVTTPITGRTQGATLTTSAPLRMLAGYSGPAQRDSAGDLWEGDRYFTNGWSMSPPFTYIARTSDPLIFRYGRAGDFDYDIPLSEGEYELHLYFIAHAETSQSEDTENKSVFNVTINGTIVLQNFDIVSDALGRNIADERVLRDVTPGADGKLHLHFSTVIGTPSLSAIQILKGIPHAQLPIRIVTQSSPFTDHNGTVWHPDNYFMGGRHLSHNIPASDLSESDWFSTERYGHFTYAIPADTRDRYTVVLYFKELFFGTKDYPQGKTGDRVFRVLCNGIERLDDFDILKEGSPGRVVVKSFDHVKPTAQGKIDLTFEPITNYATLSAIEVLDESQK